MGASDYIVIAVFIFGGMFAVIWYFVQRHISRVDVLEKEAIMRPEFDDSMCSLRQDISRVRQAVYDDHKTLVEHIRSANSEMTRRLDSLVLEISKREKDRERDKQDKKIDALLTAVLSRENNK